MLNDNEELLSDEYFVEMSSKYNPKYKRFSRSQPVSPRHYYRDEFNFDAAPTTNAYRKPPVTPTLNTSYSSTPRSVRFKHKYQANHDASQQPLKPTSIWRKNREAFLKNMDKKLEQAMHKFESKTGGDASGQIARHPIAGKFHSKPLTRKRGHSYHQNSFEMQQVIAERQREDQRERAHKSSQSTVLHKEWLTTKTTFSKYNDRLTKNEETKEDEALNMVPRRSLSLPSSPKHCDNRTNFVDTLDLGDDEQEDDEEEEEEEEEEESHQDVLEDEPQSQTPHISDESSISNDDEEVEVKNGNLYMRKESESIHYDRSIQRRRRRKRLKNRNREYDNEESSSSDDEESDDDMYYNRKETRMKPRRNRYQFKDSDDEDSDKDIVQNHHEQDMDQRQYEYYQTKKRNSKIHLMT
eukprot:160336_1